MDLLDYAVTDLRSLWAISRIKYAKEPLQGRNYLCVRFDLTRNQFDRINDELTKLTPGTYNQAGIITYWRNISAIVIKYQGYYADIKEPPSI